MDLSLRLEVKIKDAENIIKWLENEDVTKYLNEDIHSAYTLKSIIEQGQADLLTYYLNQDGRFYLIDIGGESLGFINLFTIREKKEYEVVITIGEPNNLGKGIGYCALKEMMKEVFFQWRIDSLIAKINIENERRKKLFLHHGFQEVKRRNNYIHFRLTLDDYLKYLKSHK